MTITSQTNTWGPYAGINSAGQVFAVSDKFIAETDLTVIQTDSAGAETTLALTTDYTVLGAGDAGGGSVTVIAAVPLTSTINIFDEIPYTQTTALPLGGKFPSTTVELALDRNTKQVQRVRSISDLKIGVLVSEGLASTTLNPYTAGAYVRGNVGGTGFEMVVGDPNDDSFTQSGTGAVERTVTSKLGERVTLYDFGAVAGGIVDNTEAVNNAFASGATEIIIPDAVFYCDGNLTPVSDMLLRGEGAAELLAGANSTRFLNCTSLTNIEFKNFIVNGNKAVATGVLNNALIWCNNSQGIKFKGVRTKESAGSGIAVKQTDTPGADTDVVFDDCDVHDNDQHGIQFVSTSEVSLRGNRVYDNTLQGVDATGTAENECSGFSAVDNRFNGNGTNGLLMHMVDDDYDLGERKRIYTEVTIRGNHAIGNGYVDVGGDGHGMGLQILANEMVVEGNICKGNGASGMWVGALVATVNGNICKGNYEHGIDLAMAQDVSVAGNVAKLNGIAGISVEKVEYAAVGINVVANNRSDAIRTAFTNGAAYTFQKIAGLYVTTGPNGVNAGGTQDVAVVGNVVASGPNQEYGILADTRDTGVTDSKRVLIRDNVVVNTAQHYIEVTGITDANPGVVSAAGHDFDNGESVFLKGQGGMVEVNDRFFTVANTDTGAGTFEIADTSGYTAWSAGGTPTVNRLGDIVAATDAATVFIEDNIVTESSPITTSFASETGGALILPPTGKTFKITEGFDVDTITSADGLIPAYREITLVFSDATPGDVKHGTGNIVLVGAADFSPVQFGVIELTWDGTNWVG